jgi:DNA-binding response OmpR family regulator
VPVTDGPVTLLVVDDEEPIRNALRRFLAQQGVHAALESAVIRRQALVFLDDARV